MDDRFMNELRRDPDPAFRRGLQEKLHGQEMPRARALRPLPALSFGLAAAVIVALFAFPSVRVSAQSMLDLFRVRKFAAVEFDPSRLEKLEDIKDEKSLLFFDTTKLEEPGPPQVYATLEEGAAAAGLAPMRPTLLQGGLVPDTVMVQPGGAAQLTVSETKLRAVLEALSLHDVQVPAGLDGKIVEVRKPKMLVQQFVNGKRRAGFMQSMSPEVSVPAGLDIERLAEVGLRILGLDAGEARRIAGSTDWRSTLVVPVPLNASTFRQVTVHGQPGLLVTTRAATSGGDSRPSGSVVLWTEGDRVFGMVSNLGPDDVLVMAESVR